MKKSGFVASIACPVTLSPILCCGVLLTEVRPRHCSGQGRTDTNPSSFTVPVSPYKTSAPTPPTLLAQLTRCAVVDHEDGSSTWLRNIDNTTYMLMVQRASSSLPR
jgi:hypothetical protein